jgi:hypothetical protein
MPESFGVRLRQQRERQQIALATIASQTKIKLSLLEELERDDVSHWPTGIFRRAFVRAYAHAIGLDQDAVVRQFLEVHPDPPEIVETCLPAHVSPGMDGVAASITPPIRLRYLVGSAIDSLSKLRRGTADSASEKPNAAGPHVQPAAAPPDEPLVRDMERATAAPPDLTRLARFCTECVRLDGTDASALVQEIAEILGAVGFIVWSWDPEIEELRPAMAHGYSDRVLAQLPRVRRDADNATAAAFRSGQTCVVRGSESTNGALVVPVMAPAGCVGVLAIELRYGSEKRENVRNSAIIIAAQLVRFVEIARATAAAERRLA